MNGPVVQGAGQAALDVVAFVFLLGSVGKLSNLHTFRVGLLGLPYMRRSWTYLVGYGLPFLELGVAAGLYGNLLIAKVAALTLLVLFSGMAFASLSRGLEIPCNCFGTSADRRLSWATIAENSVLILLIGLSFGLKGRVDGAAAPLATAFAVVAYTVIGGTVRNVRTTNELKRQGAFQ